MLAADLGANAIGFVFWPSSPRRISVTSGQYVLAGEPIGAMGEARVASASADTLGNDTPELYVEFRKDGKPVDPSPWRADRHSGRTGNGT